MANCPQLANRLAADDCVENPGGLGSVMYVLEKKYINTAKFKLEDGSNAYPALEVNGDDGTLKTGAQLYKFECKENGQGMTNTSLGRCKMFRQQLDYVLEAVNAESAKVARALNNLDLAYIVKRAGVWYIIYDPDHKFVYDNGGISFETGKTPEDDAQVNLSGYLSPTLYPLYTVEEPEAGWDSLVAA